MHRAQKIPAQPSSSAAVVDVSLSDAADQTAQLPIEHSPILIQLQRSAPRQVNSFMVSGQRRVAKRPRAREHQR